MRPKILILDDVIPYLDSLERALSFDYEVIKASNLKEAQIKSNPDIDLFLIDICLDENMAGEDRSGLVFLKWVKENFPEKPAVVMSAYRDYEGAVEALNIWAFKYLKKPISLSELKATIEEGIKIGKSN
jgi:DNA-binding NtrC family response regulator